MGTPVALTVEPKASVVELSGKTYASVKLVDANGVKCDATKKGTDISVNGYAVAKAEINQTEKEFSAMLDELTGSEFDMEGLAKLRNLLKEGENDVGK